MTSLDFEEFIERILRENERALTVADVSVATLVRYFVEQDRAGWKDTGDYQAREQLTGNVDFVVTALKVPNDASPDHPRILAVIRALGRIWFKDCEFHCGAFDLGDERYAAYCFENCTFKAAWDLDNGVVLHNPSGAMFHRCHFALPIRLSGCLVEDDLASQTPASAFSTCTFESDLVLNGANLEAPIFIDGKADCVADRKRFLRLKIRNTSIKARFILNDAEIESFECIDSVFTAKAEMKNCRIKNFQAENTNFEKLVDFYETSFAHFVLRKSILSDFVGFEACQFGDPDVQRSSQTPEVKPESVKFEYATFMSFANFRDTRFYTGLDLRNSNRKELPNFIGAWFSTDAQKMTDRESFRIIKHSFDAVGNHVDGNTFFAMEMRSYRTELKGTKRYAERLLLWCNDIFADFGQSYLRPIIWLIALVGLFAGVRHGQQQNWLYRVYPPLNDFLGAFSFALNEWAKNLKIFNPIMWFEMEFLSIVFGVAFSILIWLTVVSIRRHSKR